MNSMAKFAIGLVAGVVFGLALVLSEMTNPARILGFLDVFGHWDPRLAFVMVGAIAVHAPVVYWLRRRGKPFIESKLSVPPEARIDMRLILGAALFGIGWGVAGYCPGPAVVAATRGGSALLLVVSMVVGMGLHEVLVSRRTNAALRAPREPNLASLEGAQH